MVRIVTGKELKSFYEKAIREGKSNKEDLILEVSKDFKNFLKDIEYKKAVRVFDLGYGYGNYSIELAKKGFNVTAIDFISPKYLKQKIKKLKLDNKIKVIQKNLNDFTPRNKIFLVLSIRTLHMLNKEKLVKLLKKLIKMTKNGGWHYITIFVDIKRRFKNGEKVVIKNEANLSRKSFINIIKKLYKEWNLRIKCKKRVELNHSGLEKPFDSFLKEIILIAQKTK